MDSGSRISLGHEPSSHVVTVSAGRGFVFRKSHNDRESTRVRQAIIALISNAQRHANRGTITRTARGGALFEMMFDAQNEKSSE
jgi:hypothetical protein